jgi:ATP-dependent DNA helicase 2 subunit 1
MNRDSIIFLIDAQKPMFEETLEGEIPFHNAVKCAISTLTDKIISSESDLVGICFYGTVR